MRTASLSSSLARFRPITAVAVLAAAAAVVPILALGAPRASASSTAAGLGNAAPFAVLGGSAVTTRTPSLISGDLGVWPGTSVTGTPVVIDGSVYRGTGATGVAKTAQAGLGTAYTTAAERVPTTLANYTTTNLGGKSLTKGVYNAKSTLELTGTLTLNGGGTPDAVFVFQAGSSLITASGSNVSLIGTAQACNVFWQVGSSATLGTASTFTGTILALTSITVTTKVTVAGRVLARNGAVTLTDDTITRPATCVTKPSATGTTTTTTTTPPATTTPSATTTPPSTATKTSTTTSTGSTTPTRTASTTTTAVATAGGSGVDSSGSGGSGMDVAPAAAVVPVGAPETGAGGASRSGADPLLLALGGLALLGAGAAVLQAVRRRRELLITDLSEGSRTDGHE